MLRSMTYVVLAACVAVAGCMEDSNPFQQSQPAPSPTAARPTPTPKPTPKPVAADKNPLYMAWASFPVGSTSKISTFIAKGDKKRAQVANFVLKQVTSEKVVVEVWTETIADSITERSPKETVEFAAKSQGTKKGIESTEEVVIAGKSYECRKTSEVVTSGDKRTIMTSWTSKIVPGGVVKATWEEWVGDKKTAEVQNQLISYTFGPPPK